MTDKLNLEIKTALKSLNKFAVSTFASTVMRFGLRLVKNVVFTRLLGPFDRGVYGLITTIPRLITIIGDLGYGLGSIYLVSKKKCDIQKVLSNTILFAAVLGLVLMGICYGVLSFEKILKDDVRVIKPFMWIVLLTLPFFLLETKMSNLLIGLKKIHDLNFFNTLFSGLPVVLMVFLWLITGRALQAALWAWALSIVIVSIGEMWRISPGSIFPLKFSWTYLKDSLFYGARSYVSTISNEFVRHVDIILVASMLGAEALGYYTTCVAISEILLTLPDAISLPFLPIRLEMEQKHAKGFSPFVIRNLLFLMLLACIVTAVFGKWIIILLFGREFLPSYQAILFLLPGILSLSIYNLIKVDIYSHDRPGFVSWIAILALVINVGLNLILIPRLGINGAALSSTVAYSFSTICLLVYLIRLTHSSYRDILLFRFSDWAIVFKQWPSIFRKIKLFWAKFCVALYIPNIQTRWRYHRSKKKLTTILLYHRVIPRDQLLEISSLDGMVVYEDIFEQQMQYLSQHYYVMKMEEWLHKIKTNEPLPYKTVLITFDDGWQDNYQYAYPVLKKYSVPATIFLTTQYVGHNQLLWHEKIVFLVRKTLDKPLREVEEFLRKRDAEDLLLYLYPLFKDKYNEKMFSQLIEEFKLMLEEFRELFVSLLWEYLGYPKWPLEYNAFLNWKEIANMDPHLIEFGSHGITHRLMTDMGTVEGLKEVVESKKTIEQKIQKSVVCLAYPNGNYNAQTITWLQQAGYECGLTVRHSLNINPNLFALKRINISLNKTLDDQQRFSKEIFECILTRLLK